MASKDFEMVVLSPELIASAGHYALWIVQEIIESAESFEFGVNSFDLNIYCNVEKEGTVAKVKNMVKINNIMECNISLLNWVRITKYESNM